MVSKQTIKNTSARHVHYRLIALTVIMSAAVLTASGALVWRASSQLYAARAASVAQHDPLLGTIDDSELQAAGQSSGDTKTKSTASSSSSNQPASQPAAGSASAAQPSSSSAIVPPASVPSGAVSSSNLRGLNLYVDPSRAGLPSPLGSSPVAAWFGDWNANIQSDVNTLVSAAAAKGAVATLVAYNIPNRDCGSYSSGGAANTDAYKSWIRSFAAGIGNRQAIVILEPDALAQGNCLDATRYALLQDAASVLRSQTRAFVYLDAGNSSWIEVNDMAGRLNKVGLSNLTGFSLNVSNFETTANSTAYGTTLSSKTGGKHFVIDTSRNGNGPGDTWCNPTGRALGAAPTTATTGAVDAYLWIKVPGESDGTCGGGPSAGTYWPSYAQGLINNRR